jgi:UDP-2,4-diacetamido-2,4,6-trideoxy-beta-L-altropyranose hydrolase
MTNHSILIRLDADQKTGLGHLYRSLAIADELKKTNVNPVFIIGKSRTAEKEIKKHAFEYRILNHSISEEEKIRCAISDTDAKLLFIDKLYPYTAEFIGELKKTLKTAMFHNDCKGTSRADAFILPSAHSPQALIDNYQKVKELHFYYGPQYVVLNPAAIETAKKARITPKQENKICITTGGSDPEGLMIGILNALNKQDFSNYEIKALIGSNFIHREALEKLLPKLQTSIKCIDFDINEFTDAGCALATFGVSTYELMHAGIPILSTAHAEANATGSKNAEIRHHCLKDIGLFKNMTQKEFLSAFTAFINDTELKIRIGKNAKALIDGKGAQRTAKILAELAKQ